MEAGKRTINDIFNGNRILEIPFFQRSYVWGEEQWERLLTDMVEVSKTNKPYFLGSVILKQQITDTKRSVGDVRTVVDGQQRLTTLNIFFKTLCLKLKQNSLFERVFKLINNDIALLHNHNDIGAFNEILGLSSPVETQGKDNISQAYNYFLNNIEPNLLNIQNILTNIMFVGIDLGVDEDEQQIFDTINSLGMRLTTAELLKNYLFSRDDLHSYTENWKKIFELSHEQKEFWDMEITAGRIKRNNIDLFFYSFLQIKIQDKKLKVKSDDKNSFSKVEGLFDSYKRFITDYKIDKNEIILEIKEYATIYQKFIDFDVIDRALTNKNGIDRINAIIFGLENTTLIPYVLFVLKNAHNLSEINNICGYLESYIMRRMICRTTNKNYNQLFSERLISNNILTKEKLKEYINSLSDKINYMPADPDLRHGFHNSKLINKQTAGIIYFIESKIRNTNIHSTALLGLNRYSLEHLMPKKWLNNWEPTSTEEEKIIRNRKLLTLGNLAIITSSLNTSIRDSSWVVKKVGKKDKKGLTHYSAGIDTLGEFLPLKIWDEDSIEERANFLYEKASSIWLA